MCQKVLSLETLAKALETELSPGSKANFSYRNSAKVTDLPGIRIEAKVLMKLIQKEEQIAALRQVVDCQEKEASALGLENLELKRKIKDLKSLRDELLTELETTRKEMSELRSNLRNHAIVKTSPSDLSDYSKAFTQAVLQTRGRYQYDSPPSPDTPLVSKGPVPFEDLSIYIGEWNSQSQRHGRGEQIWKDGSKYEGYWKCGKAYGKGRKTYENGDVYIGDWVDDKAHGEGVFLHSDGRRYVGDWKNDMEHGFGVETWPDGARYEGSYSAGKKEGEGKFTWADGSTYQGQLQDTNIHGIGIYTWPDGRKYIGGWKRNMMNGHGIHTWADGRKYEGEYLNDKRHGFGEFIWSDGSRYKGNWQAGKQHGVGTLWKMGKRREGEWERGTRVRWISEESSDDSP